MTHEHQYRQKGMPKRRNNLEYGCIGEKLPHSFSKEIHEKIEDYDYRLYEIARGDLASFMEKADFKAINVTIPYKQAVIPFLTELSPKAAEIGAVNTIVNRDGKLYGYNTDYMGMDALFSRLHLSPEGKKVLILGTGGTSKTAFCLMKQMGAREILKVSRTPKDGDGTISYEDAENRHMDTQIIINTTPCGMFPHADEKPISLSPFKNLEGVVDAVYNPLRTELIKEALTLHLKAEGGLFMLVAQAVYAAEFFTGKKYREGLIDRVFEEILSEKERSTVSVQNPPGF